MWSRDNYKLNSPCFPIVCKKQVNVKLCNCNENKQTSNIWKVDSKRKSKLTFNY